MSDGQPTEGSRSTLVREVFQQCVDARLNFNRALMQCASRGWPDKKASIDVAFRVQEAMLTRLMVRLDYLVRRLAPDAEWRSYTSTALVQARLQGNWTSDNEAALIASDEAYARLNREVESLRRRADPAALEGPYQMARRDPELIAAGQALNDKILALDKQLSAQP